jgi:hypothetical protein
MTPKQPLITGSFALTNSAHVRCLAFEGQVNFLQLHVTWFVMIRAKRFLIWLVEGTEFGLEFRTLQRGYCVRLGIDNSGVDTLILYDGKDVCWVYLVHEED